MKISALVLTFLLIFLSATRLGSDRYFQAYFVIWNVGQGQWTTWSDDQTCTHFDVGGERSPLREIKSLCGTKDNRIYLSHWDWDHIGLLKKAKRILTRACIALAPLGKSSPHKMKLLETFDLCSDTSTKDFSAQEVTLGKITAPGKKNTNDASHVMLVQKNILIPGDSTTTQEKKWDLVPGISQTRYLVLGHHGSRTSTSEDLLQKMPHLKMAISSARFAKYGHPHGEVLARLQRHYVPLLRTEDWGNIWFEF
jgi:competence protein ComEC